MIHVDFKMFIDRKRVADRLSRKTRRVMGIVGGFGRQVMRRQFRPAGKKGKSSQPGEPPRARVGLMKKLTYFGVERDGESVVIGPMALKPPKGHKLHGRVSVAHLLDQGGRETLLTPDGGTAVAQYLPRPFVDPVRPTIEEKLNRTIEEIPL